MTHRVHPYIFRLGETTTWKSRWLNRKQFVENLREDTLLREWLAKRLRQGHIESIEIERAPNTVQIIIKTSRPGLLIGRSGEGADKLKREIQSRLLRIRKRFGAVLLGRQELKLTIEEVRSPETHAVIAAQMIADDIEKRIPFRRAMKQAISKIAASKEVKGVKLALKGRLDGAEMARYEWLKKGRIPLQTLRADVDYAEKTAYTTYGTIGVKVWIYKGDVFQKMPNS
ncbi:MAG: 30S ribosomal protein S3 [Candidatus Sungbacteria bacterium]|nr:30S ribosomal protein S3 [Candidatus Sungbacteria bacterium]